MTLLGLFSNCTLYQTFLILKTDPILTVLVPLVTFKCWIEIVAVPDPRVVTNPIILTIPLIELAVKNAAVAVAIVEIVVEVAATAVVVPVTIAFDVAAVPVPPPKIPNWIPVFTALVVQNRMASISYNAEFDNVPDTSPVMSTNTWPVVVTSAPDTL